MGGSGAGLPGWSRGGGRGRSCWGYWLTCRARTAGASPSMPVMPPRTGCSTSWRGALGCRWVRDDLRGYVVEHLSNADAVLVVDETGDLKKAPGLSGCSGSHRYPRADQERPGRGLHHLCRPAGPYPNRPRALPVPVLDRRPGPLQGSGIPGRTRFAAKPRLTRRMIPPGPGCRYPGGLGSRR
jgi:hypothetical protein